MKKISLCFNDRKKNKKQKLENFFWGGGVYIYLDLLFSVHTIQEKKKNSIVKKILSTQID